LLSLNFLHASPFARQRGKEGYRGQCTTNIEIVEATGSEHAVNAPPILYASSHTMDAVCGNCEWSRYTPRTTKCTVFSSVARNESPNITVG